MSDTLPEITCIPNESAMRENERSAVGKESVCDRDSIIYEVDDKMNMTCPSELIGFDVNLLRNLTLQDAYLREQLQSSVTSALVGQDPCTLDDDQRDELMRQKRKEDAYKTALCESYRRTSTCTYGDECRFAHGVSELRLPTQPRGRSHPKYKTVLCDKFSNSGYCKYGARCQFIHKITNPAILAQQRFSREHNSSKTSHFYSDATPSVRPQYISTAPDGKFIDMNHRCELD
uniref:C3H1-type domain-containing protein n=1 Tax=Heterorhabditis bacteriophora TaxID=37862 RepID=A0A1I7XUC9_HETBA